MENLRFTSEVAAAPEKVVRWLFTAKLVTDRTRKALVSDPYFQQYGPRLASDQFLLVVLNALDFSPGTQDHAARQSRPVLLEAESIQNAFCDCFPNQFLCYPFLVDGELYVLVNLDLSGETAVGAAYRMSQEFLRYCSLAQTRIKQLFGVRLQLFVSPLIDGFDQMQLRFDDLNHMLYSDLNPSMPLNAETEDIFTQERMDDLMAQSITKDLSTITELEQQFYIGVIRKDFDEVYRVTCEMIDIESASFSAAISLKHRLCNKIESIFSLLGVPYFEEDGSAFGLHQMLWQIENAITVDDLKAQMHMTINEFSRFFTSTIVPTSVRMGRIAEYINEHYMDPALCANQLCDLFDISISYLSRAFKAHIGVKLIDYIHKTKLDAAKRQLLETDDTVEKVATDVGYQSALTFTRAFKRYEATTPGMYRNRAYLEEHRL